MQQASVPQPHCPSACPSDCPADGPSDGPSDLLAVPHTNPRSKTDDTPSYHVLSSESAPAEADAAEAAHAGPDTAACKEGNAEEPAAEDCQPINSQTTGHDSPTPELQSACMKTVQNGEGSSVRAQASTAKHDTNTAGTSCPFSPSPSAAPAQAAKGAATLPPAPVAVAAAAQSPSTLLSPPISVPAPILTTASLGRPAPAPPAPPVPAPPRPPAPAPPAPAAPAQAAGPASAPKAAACEAEAVVMEAVSAAVALVEAFPHLMEDLVEALASGLRCAIGTGLDPFE